MTRILFIFLFSLFLFSPAFAEEPKIKIAGAFADIDPELLKLLPCPSAMKIAIPTTNRNLAIRRGAKGKVESLSFDLTLRSTDKNKVAGRCTYNIVVNDFSILHSDFSLPQDYPGSSKSPELEKIKAEKDGKDGRVNDDVATAYRKTDQSGEQVIGLTVPLLSEYTLRFSEVSLETVYKINQNVKEDGTTETSFSLKSKSPVSNASLFKKVAVEVEGQATKFRNDSYGDVTLIVSLTE